MTRPIAVETRDAIVEMLQQGVSVTETAKRFSVSKSTVSGVASAANVVLERSSVKQANEAKAAVDAVRKDFDQAARIELLNKFADKIEGLVDSVSEPREIKDLAVALAVTIDKRRLEDGDATSRTETIASGARDRLAHRIDELAARRGTQSAAS